MANLKALKNRIKSVKSTQKITKAMKMVAASKLRRAQTAAENARPYSSKMEKILTSLALSFKENENAPKLLAGNGKNKVHLVISFTSDRGLCGAFNGSIVKSTRAKVRSLLEQGKEVKIITVGKKGGELLRSQFGERIIERIEGISKRNPTFADTENIANKIMDMYEKGEFDVCTIIYNRFKSAIAQEVTAQQLIPLDTEGFAHDEEFKEEKTVLIEREKKFQTVYEYEPGEEEILTELLPRNLTIQIYHALLESSASEHASRMTAMDNATRNAGDMIKDLTLVYNRSRQAAITKELIEIISGAEAV